MSERKEQWTPGPWYAVRMRGYAGLCIGRRCQETADSTAGDAPVATMCEGAPHWDNKYPIEANAHLIAAAPELYEALNSLANTADCFRFIEDEIRAAAGNTNWQVLRTRIEAARAALAKARGEA